MFSTGDDIVLSVWRERGEEGGIARDTHYQIAILIGMFFRIQQRFAGNDVVLNMPAFMHLEEGAQQHHQLLLIGLVLQRGRIQLLVEQRELLEEQQRQIEETRKRLNYKISRYEEAMKTGKLTWEENEGCHTNFITQQESCSEQDS